MYKEDTFTMKEYKDVMSQNVQLKETIRNRNLFVRQLRDKIQELRFKLYDDITVKRR